VSEYYAQHSDISDTSFAARTDTFAQSKSRISNKEKFRLFEEERAKKKKKKVERREEKCHSRKKLTFS